MRKRHTLLAATTMFLISTGAAFASTIIEGSISFALCTSSSTCASADYGGDAPMNFVGRLPTVTNILSLKNGLPTGAKNIFSVNPASSAGTTNNQVAGTLQVLFSFWEYNTTTKTRVSGVTGSLVEDATFQANYRGTLPCSSSTGQSDCVYWTALGATLNSPGDGSKYSTSGDKDNISSVASVTDIVTMSNGDKFAVNFFDAQDWNITPDVSFNLLTVTGNNPSTPLPAALPLFATGLGGLGLLGWRRKRKAQAVA